MGYFTGRLLYETVKIFVTLTYFAVAFMIVTAFALMVIAIVAPVALVLWIISRYIDRDLLDEARKVVTGRDDEARL